MVPVVVAIEHTMATVAVTGHKVASVVAVGHREVFAVDTGNFGMEVALHTGWVVVAALPVLIHSWCKIAGLR
jgi:hypothetical protein